MKILYSWLQDYIDLNLTPAEMADKFIALGIEVAEIKTTGADFEGVHAAKIEKIDRHPNADKLSLVTLKTKDGSQRVVCGAKNLVEGDIIALARVGARLGKNVLEAAEIRGVVSEGMICSSDELGLTDTRQSGIMVLDKNLEVGKDIAKLYGGKADVVFDLEITSNRPDLLSHLGIARELSVLLNLPLKNQDYKLAAGKSETLKIKLEAVEEGCRRYIGQSIKNINNVQSPAWLKDRLRAMGVNPKNAVVDITNYVLYAVGHPLHAFDLNHLEAGEIRVRFADEGEKFEGLDGIERSLSAQTLVIADGKKPVALAGVLGGRADSICENTKNIFLESAWFYPQTINKTSKKLGISTEASQRFERGADIEACPKALALAVKLITEICGGEVSLVNDVYAQPYAPAIVKFTAEEINKILGMDIPEQKLKEIFTRMDTSFKAAGGEWQFSAPSYRPDISHKWDLAEEAARFYGFENLAPGNIAHTSATLYFAENPKSVDLGEKLCSALSALGFYECKNFDFVSFKDINAFGYDDKTALEVKNPLAEGMEFMRPVLLGSLLKNVEFNHKQSRADLSLFEHGKTFSLQKGYPAEAFCIAGALTGAAPRGKFFAAQQKEIDFYFLKGVMAFVLEDFADIALNPSVTPPPYMHPKICADILCEGRVIGNFGMLHPLTAKTYDIKTDVWVFEFALKNLEKQFDAQTFKKARDISVYPSSKRDLSLLIDANIAFDKVESALKTSAPGVPYCLIDLYQGENVPQGKKSITLRFEFSSMEKTLTDKEINAQMDNILFEMKNFLRAELR